VYKRQAISTLSTEFGGGYAMSSYYRGGSFVPNSPQNAAIPTSGAIALSNFYGSSNRMIISLTASGNNYDVFANRGPTYQAGKSDITVTVPGTVGSANTGSYALLVPNGFNAADTVTLVNNGLIQGAGGAGGGGGNGPFAGAGGGGGGSAVYVNRPVTIFNNNTLAGGGGGGGGGSGGFNPQPIKVGGPRQSGGGGGGGGAGTNAGGAGAGGSGVDNLNGSPGGAGTSAGGGAGGSRYLPWPPTAAQSSNGGAGGGRGAAGTAAATGGYGGGAGGGAGNYIVGNGFVTWGAFGTRQGGAS
jgi:hypothetical protein